MTDDQAPAPAPRTVALNCAAALFYAHGVRAVGMEQIVAASGIAKTTIYRHFPTKDALIAAFLEREDAAFWRDWEAQIASCPAGIAKLDALAGWIGDRVRRAGYRGCPQINVAAEFAAPDHPARQVARRHKAEMHRRVTQLCQEIGVARPEHTAMQIALLFDGAFMSDGRLAAHWDGLLMDAVHRLVGADRPG